MGNLGTDIGLGAVLKTPRQSNAAQSMYFGALAKGQANRQKENSDALTSLDDYVVVDKNFLPSTAKQAVELSRDFNNKAMQLIGTPNAKNKIHDLYVKDYSVQLQMLRGANQAKLDYINADQSGKFNTYPDLAQKFQTSEDYQGINKAIAEKQDNTLLSDGDKQFAFTPKPKFQEGTLFNTQENDYLANDPRVVPRKDGYDEIINTKTLSPEVVANKRQRLLNDPTFIDTQLHELPASVRNDPSFDPQKYVEAKADELLDGRLQKTTTAKYLQKQPVGGKGMVLNFNTTTGAGSNDRFAIEQATRNVVKDAKTIKTPNGDKVTVQGRGDRGWVIKDLTAGENAPQFWSAETAYDFTTGKNSKGLKKKGAVTEVWDTGYRLEDDKGNLLRKFDYPIAIIKTEEGSSKTQHTYVVPYNPIAPEIEAYTANKKGQGGWRLPGGQATQSPANNAKVLKGTSAQLDQAAKNKGMSRAEYEKMLKDSGYEIEVQ